MHIIYKAMAAIQRGIHEIGVGKVRKNKEQGFNFRGIDDALSAFAPLLTEHGVVVLPAYSDLTVSPRKTKNGGDTFNVSVCGQFTFVAVEDGSQVTVGPFYGEANDGQDKAISKATSVAYRNALFLAFCVPHEPAIGGDPDATGEPEDATGDWLSALAACVDMTGVNKLKAELIAACGGVDGVPAKLRTAFVARTNELKKAA